MIHTPTLEIHRLWEKKRLNDNQAKVIMHNLKLALEDDDQQAAAGWAKGLYDLTTESNSLLNQISDLEY